MKRTDFLKLASLAPLSGFTMKLNYLNNLTHEFTATEKMPVLFLGHGSPMNAIEENEFVTGFRKIASEITVPTAILCVSAHWETKGTFVTAMEKPRTIHDFGGFPEELFAVQYPAPGSPDLAKLTQQTVKKTNIQSDLSWGLDHGAWSVVKHLFPKADIPIIQMSIDYTQKPEYHYELANQLASLRKKGVLIIGSGNIVHNLRKVAWDKLNVENYAYDWALEAKSKMNDFILNDNHNSLINYEKNGAAFQLAIPTPEHFLPLLYTLALKDKTDSIELFNDKALGGSLTMTSVKIF